jgi:O-antigen ligase
MVRIAQLLTLILITWLLVRDVRLRTTVSGASWISVLWAIILSTRPVTEWLSSGLTAMTPEAYLEGSPPDRAAFTALIVAGAVVLFRRREAVVHVLKGNRWLLGLYAYLLLSVFWSDYPFVAFKRWFKECGSLIAALIIMTEANPSEAVKAVFLRCTYVLVPLSFLLIRFMPDIGRAYTGHNASDLMYVGVTNHKNTLGALLLTACLVLFWSLLSASSCRTRRRFWWFDHALVLLAAFWLLRIANSATSVVGVITGIGLLVALRMDSVRRQVPRFELLAVALGTLWLLLDPILHIAESIVTSLGRDMTLTSRTGAWDLVLRSDSNPLIGVGFKSFWAGERMAKLWVDLPGIVQAHNGYIETYLEGGLIAVSLLMALLLTGVRAANRRTVLGDNLGQVQLTFLVVTLAYNCSEAAFTQRSLIWLITLVAVLPTVSSAQPSLRAAAPKASPPPLNSELTRRARVPASLARRAVPNSFRVNFGEGARM